MAEMLEISDILGKYPSSVSGGQQQRTSLGRALIRDAGLYLLDEPMGQLEPQLRAVLRGRIKHYLREHHCTTILVTHDQTEANALADRIAVMEGGILQQYATPAELKARPANVFTGTFIGEPPMNVLSTKVRPAAKGVSFDLPDGQLLSYGGNELSAPVRNVLLNQSEIVIGVRPHALHVGQGPLKGKIISCQWLGDQTHVAIEVAGKTLVSVAHERVIAKPGETVGLSILGSDLHLFDANTGIAISHGVELA
jgi:multiple sugar transport system ATP-binding protein